MTVSDDPKSPCINLCQIDPSAGICIGCLRNLDEIARWSAMTAHDRRQVLDKLSERARVVT